MSARPTLRGLLVLVTLAAALVGCTAGGGGRTPPTDVPGAGAGGGLTPCDPPPSITPGEGVGLCGQAVRLGDPAPAGAVVHDLGAPGVRWELREASATGFLDAAGSGGRVTQVSVQGGSPGPTPEGVTLGATAAAVRAAYGEPAVDPFLGTWWYRSRGIGFEWKDGAVSVVHVFHATP
jgi:hypothetical protein